MLPPEAFVRLNPMVRAPWSTVVSSCKPSCPLVRFDTIAASSHGNALALIQALMVTLPVSWSS